MASTIHAINHQLSKLRALQNHNWDIYHETYYTESIRINVGRRIVTVHDMIHEKFPQYFESENATSRLKLEAVNRADHVICVSENTKKDLMARYSIPEQKISVVHHGCSLSPESVGQTNHSDRKPFILYVGHRDKYKNAETMVRAYASSAYLKENFQLIFFGGGGLTRREMEFLQSLSLSERHVSHHSGGDEVLSRLYSTAAAYVCPSLYEGFGMPLLEAMSHNCPVICSNVSSLPEVAGDAAEYFNPEDKADIRRAMEYVVTSPTHSAELAMQGLVRSRQFSWEKCAAETLAVYQKAMNQ